jgi:hypothetical protein
MCELIKGCIFEEKRCAQQKFILHLYYIDRYFDQ